MKRRLLLSSSLASLLVAPALRAFAQDRVPDDGALAGLSEAYRAAQRAHRPLLVLVIPEDNGARWERGSALGAFLNTGSDDAMVAVGVCELTCATMGVLRQLVPQAPEGEPLMVLVDPSHVPAVASAIDPALPPPIEAPRSEDAWRTYDARMDAYVDQQVAAIERAVTAALRTRTGALSAAERAAALQRTTDTHRAHRIRGSYWATQGGCGVYVEELPETGGMLCGMGHTPARAERFLYFFAPQGPR